MNSSKCYRASRSLLPLLAVAILIVPAAAQARQATSSRKAYNPVSGRTETARRPASKPFRQELQVELASYCDGNCTGCDQCSPACGLPGCGLPDNCCDIGCGDAVCGTPRYSSRGRNASFYGGFEATFLKPRFKNNEAFTVMEANGATFETFTNTQFDYDLELAPRIFLGWEHGDGVGFRTTWWQFDQEAGTETANPPANSFGLITHPTFGDVDLSSEVPTNTFTAASDLNAYTIDLEFTKATRFCAWEFGLGCGFRYAYTEQSYRAELQNANNDSLGNIDFRHSLEGYGPTVSLEAYRSFNNQSGIFCKARGSILFGDGESRLTAVEDATLGNPFDTTSTLNVDDQLSIGELQVGYRWKGRKLRHQTARPFLSIAMEGQIWNEAGNASSDAGNLGFIGFNAGAGFDW